MIRYFLRKFQIKTEDFPTYRLRLATIYAFVAGNAFVYGFWCLIKEKVPDTPEKKELFRQRKKSEGMDVTFITLDGFTLTYDHPHDKKSIPKEDIEEM